MTDPVLEEILFHELEAVLNPMGYELVELETVYGRGKLLRLYIDCTGGVGLDDCAKVSQMLDPVLDASATVESLFKSGYELEVSSPGIERPLRKPKDYARFAGEHTRIHLNRPLTADESQAPDYVAKNPKQKNYFGKLLGFETLGSQGYVVFTVLPEDGRQLNVKNAGVKPKAKKKKQAEGDKPEGVKIYIPHPLISKAHLVPEIDMSKMESETGEAYELD